MKNEILIRPFDGVPTDEDLVHHWAALLRATTDALDTYPKIFRTTGAAATHLRKLLEAAVELAECQGQFDLFLEASERQPTGYQFTMDIEPFNPEDLIWPLSKHSRRKGKS